jgi:hypothetical protein
MLHEDEFYDAVDAALDKMEKEEEKVFCLAVSIHSIQ